MTRTISTCPGVNWSIEEVNVNSKGREWSVLWHPSSFSVVRSKLIWIPVDYPEWRHANEWYIKIRIKIIYGVKWLEVLLSHGIWPHKKKGTIIIMANMLCSILWWFYHHSISWIILGLITNSSLAEETLYRVDPLGKILLLHELEILSIILRLYWSPYRKHLVT